MLFMPKRFEYRSDKYLLAKREVDLIFTFGVNLQNREACGLFIYSNHRLISMFAKCAKQTKKRMVIDGIVDLPSTLFEPTLNMQEFQDQRGIKDLIKVIGDHLSFYGSNMKLDNDFWN